MDFGNSKIAKWVVAMMSVMWSVVFKNMGEAFWEGGGESFAVSVWDGDF